MQPPPLAATPRQVVIPGVFPIQPVASEHQKRSAATPLHLARSFLPAHVHRLPRSFRMAVRISLVRSERDTNASLREISTQNHIPHIAMSFDPTIAWKASPTRAPPPICTSAPFLKPRWSQEPWAPRTIKKYTMRGFPQSFDSMFAASLRKCCRAATVRLESKFLNHRTESRIMASPSGSSIFHKLVTFDCRQNRIFKALGVAMGISG